MIYTIKKKIKVDYSSLDMFDETIDVRRFIFNCILNKLGNKRKPNGLN